MNLRALCTILCAGLASVALGSCSDPFFPGRPDVELSLNVEAVGATAPIGFPLTLRVALDGQGTPAVVASTSGTSRVDIRAPHEGLSTVRVDLLNADGDTLATSEFKQDFRSNYSNWIAATVGASPPIGSCVWNPAYATGTPLVANVSLFVEFGGLEKGSLC